MLPLWREKTKGVRPSRRDTQMISAAAIYSASCRRRTFMSWRGVDRPARQRMARTSEGQRDTRVQRRCAADSGGGEWQPGTQLQEHDGEHSSRPSVENGDMALFVSFLKATSRTSKRRFGY